jgi:TPR repeat protein
VFVSAGIVLGVWILVHNPSAVGFLGRHTNLPQSEQWAAHDAMVHGDFREARRLFEIGANKGNAPDQFDLGLLEYRGAGGLTDKENGVRWIKKAEANGCAPAKRRMDQYNLTPH